MSRVGCIDVPIHGDSRAFHHDSEDPIQQSDGHGLRGCDQALQAIVAARHARLRQEVQGSVREGVAVLVEHVIGTCHRRNASKVVK